MTTEELFQCVICHKLSTSPGYCRECLAQEIDKTIHKVHELEQERDYILKTLVKRANKNE